MFKFYEKKISYHIYIYTSPLSYFLFRFALVPIG